MQPVHIAALPAINEADAAVAAAEAALQDTKKKLAEMCQVKFGFNTIHLTNGFATQSIWKRIISFAIVISTHEDKNEPVSNKLTPNSEVRAHWLLSAIYLDKIRWRVRNTHDKKICTIKKNKKNIFWETLILVGKNGADIHKHTK